MIHDSEAQYEKELEELELKAAGVFAVATPNGHIKRWERKKELVRREIAAASKPEEKLRLEQKLIALERKELELGERLAALHANECL